MKHCCRTPEQTTRTNGPLGRAPGISIKPNWFFTEPPPLSFYPPTILARPRQKINRRRIRPLTRNKSVPEVSHRGVRSLERDDVKLRWTRPALSDLIEVQQLRSKEPSGRNCLERLQILLSDSDFIANFLHKWRKS